jgi:hypothetical protein
MPDASGDNWELACRACFAELTIRRMVGLNRHPAREKVVGSTPPVGSQPPRSAAMQGLPELGERVRTVGEQPKKQPWSF